MILAIDPGPVESAFVVWDGIRLHDFGKRPNADVRQRLMSFMDAQRGAPVVCEKIASYGMAVGASVFHTCFWTGRFWEMAEFSEAPFHLVERLKVKMHLCHQAKAKDGNIRQALIDRLGAPGTKREPGATYGVSKDVWAALALAVTWYDLNCSPNPTANA